ncbi:MAG: hypothetical protein GY869_27300 [Planctomycetes bacterium]|nr:hypothetical protein [Planctomycetota bacterium]
MALEFHNKVIDISLESDKPDINSWRPDQQYEGTYPEGARDKEVYFSPKDSDRKIIKANWRYLFKLPRSVDWCPWQFWAEIVAYRLGKLIGVDVPPAHAGYNRWYDKDGTGARVEAYGALIEWFYDDKEVGYIPGGQIMSHLIDDYDRDTGSQHNFMAIMEFFEDLYYERWAGVLTLDTLIANTDRHQDNWGVMTWRDEGDENVKIKIPRHLIMGPPWNIRYKKKNSIYISRK